MKKILSLFIISLVMISSALANDISADKALQIASQFAKGSTVAKSGVSRAPIVQFTPTLAHSMKSRVSAGKDNVYVINLGNDQGLSSFPVKTVQTAKSSVIATTVHLIMQMHRCSFLICSTTTPMALTASARTLQWRHTSPCGAL